MTQKTLTQTLVVLPIAIVTGSGFLLAQKPKPEITATPSTVVAKVELKDAPL